MPHWRQLSALAVADGANAGLMDAMVLVFVGISVKPRSEGAASRTVGFWTKLSDVGLRPTDFLNGGSYVPLPSPRVSDDAQRQLALITVCCGSKRESAALAFACQLPPAADIGRTIPLLVY